jgi:aldose 1-epimerase
VQFYTAAHHGPGLKGKNGQPLRRFGSLALEPQNWPDAPNHPNFPTAVLTPDDVYNHRMEWHFKRV